MHISFSSVIQNILRDSFFTLMLLYCMLAIKEIKKQEVKLMYAFSLFFVQEFNLIDRKELVPLQELIEKLTTKDR